MSDYKRLTKYNENTRCAEVYAYSLLDKDVYSDGVDIVDNENSSLAQETIDRLALLEDKIENKTLIELPCIREVNTAIAKYEVVYINKKNLIQSTLVCTKEDGWQIVSLFGNDYCKAEAEKKLKELQNER